MSRRNQFGRLIREDAQFLLFDSEHAVNDHYWGMPEFNYGNASPHRKVTINFETPQDVIDFTKATGIRITENTDSGWFPPRRVSIPLEFFYTAPKQPTRYPVCIPSKGRYDHQTTGKLLDQSGVDYKFFVEETEYEAYCERLGADRVVCLPFHDLGQGSIPARNFIWEWSKDREYARHWVLDDNITEWVRSHDNKRSRVFGGGVLNAIEDFADRYENIAMAGPHSKSFAQDTNKSMSAILLNSRVYSCILIDTSLPFRWRGKYNEDTDLSLRCLKAGYCTVLFRSLLMKKLDTVGARNSKALPGGNTDSVYNQGDHRIAFAESLKEQHPDCVEVVWKFNRWHHQVDYSRFAGNKLKMKPGVTPTKSTNEYGMVLNRKKVDESIDNGKDTA